MTRYTEERGLTLAWNDKALPKIQAGRTYLALAKVSYKGVLTNHLDVKDKIITPLKTLRNAGVPFNSSTLVIAILRLNCPDVFTLRVGCKQTPFSVSSQWIRQFVAEGIEWLFRVGYTVAHKLPDNWEEEALARCIRESRQRGVTLQHSPVAGHQLGPDRCLLYSCRQPTHI
ncbi:hypothetical protein BCR44DRAFT_271733 [Catenaria anguillulae PL171]|uniref:Uncharacterized protein n=1 Tax=Catenaria anguillulae PL171 TaxID=765915 RepID=A0A1Y2GW62_9FUNG|nr:hypothetical protein BCR44DRAFT_271733 [Catenaria anguillulae PL171]